MSRILGVDPSLTGTGLALIDTDTHRVIDTWSIPTKGGKDDTLRQRQTRIDRITHDVQVLDVDVVLIEGPSLGQSRQAGTFDRCGLWWAIVTAFHTSDVDVVEVPPSNLKKYATGKGNAAKDTVLLEVARRYPTVPVANNNEADALVLAAMGYDRVTGEPLVSLPHAHRAALHTITWPASWPAAKAA